MKLRSPSAENIKATFADIVSQLSKDSGLSREDIWKIFTITYENSTFEAAIVMARMRWLLSPAKNGINLISEFGEKSPDELAYRIMYPKQSVLDFIQKRSSFTRTDLDKIYSCLLYTSDAADE